MGARHRKIQAISMRTWRMRSYRSIVILGPLAVSACALVADLGDRTLASDASTKPNGDATPKDGSTTPEDDGSAADVPAIPPSYCTGIVLYATFDTKVEGDRGGGTTLKLGDVTQSAQGGKFGGALSLVRGSAAPDAAAALYFLANDAGNPWPEKTGSVSLWFRQTGTNDNPVLYRPVATIPPATLRTAGLAVYLENQGGNQFGLYEKGQDPVFTFNVNAVAPYLRKGEYNHYFTAWTQTGAPTAYIAINGGLGVAFADGGQNYPDAANDAGDLRVPYRGFTSRPWIVEQSPPVGLRLGGLSGNAPEGTYDDLVVWDRVLTFAEAAAVYSAGKSVGDACKLQ
jgi:hypothetical protein